MIEVKEIDKWPDNDKWAKARKDWDAMPKDEKEAYPRPLSTVGKQKPTLWRKTTIQKKRRRSSAVLLLPYFSRISILWPSIPQGIGWYPTKEINGNRAVSRIMRVYLVWIVV